MFDVLSQGFEAAVLKLRGQARLSEDNLAPALREVRASLLQADVSLEVVKDFLDRVKQRSLGEIVPLKAPGGQTIKVTPQDHFVKSCYDELVALMSDGDQALRLDGSPSVILMVGLQGSGKTTTSGKLARMLGEQGHKPLLVAADIYRPAAVEQLMVLGRRLSMPVFHIKGMDPVQLARLAVQQARSVGRDVVIIDTAGRLAVDERLMTELEQIKAAVQPQEILFVADAMIGQDAVRTASEFHRRLAFTGFVLTKLDGDARGGAALSIKAVTGRPVKLLGRGEELDGIEPFRPEGLAQRILGMGDVVGLMTDFEKHVDANVAERSVDRLLAGEFGYDDFIEQTKMLRRMGPLKEIFARLPGMSQVMKQIPAEAFDEREMDRTMAIVQSMTRQERANPDLIDASRMRRIARGCGRTVDDVDDLHQRFLNARQMMQGMGQMMMGGGLPGMGGFPPPGGLDPRARAPKPREVLTADDRAARKKKRKEAAKASRRNR